MGAISYGFYVYHYPILVIWRAALQHTGVRFGDPGFAALLLPALPIAVAASALSFYLVERPIYRRVKRKLAARREALPDAA
jgi:peptidoglycan/LPS O-acetylase OafA/YrhL